MYPDGSLVLEGGQHLAQGAREKAGVPLYGVNCRVAIRGGSAQQSLTHIAGTLIREQGANHLGVLEDSFLTDDEIVGRFTYRSGMLLTSREIATLLPLPHAGIVHPRLASLLETERQAPRFTRGKDKELFLGENSYRGETFPVGLSAPERSRHIYMVGASGTGKTTLLQKMLVDDIYAGRGVALLDPHGDLAQKVLGCIPEERINDVIFLDPSDTEHPVPFNIFHARSEAEKTLLASDLPAVFRRLSTSWGDQMHAVLANGIMAMLGHSEGGTLLTLRRFLTEKPFRENYLNGITDSHIRYYWEKEFPLLTGRPHAPVLTRLDTFLRPPAIRAMVGQSDNKIDFRSLMDGKKIFIASLAHGAIGEENAHLLGALLVASMHQAALARQDMPEEKRTPFHLYIDEFQNFVTPSMEGILSGARKYGLALTLAHQDRRQIDAKDRDVAASVLTNPYTRICFRLGDADARTLAKGFQHYSESDLQSLGIGQALMRVEQSQYDFPITTFPSEVTPDAGIAARVIAASAERYGGKFDDLLVDPYADLGESEEVVADVQAEKAQKQEKAEQKESPPRDAEPVQSAEAVEKPLPAPRTTKKKAAGKGGSQHTYLQNLIKKVGEEAGFTSSIEHAVLGGKGSIDVVLSSDSHKIAVEISVSTSTGHEVGNIQKCLAAGFGHICMIVADTTKQRRLKKAITKEFSEKQKASIHVFDPESFLHHIEFLKNDVAQTSQVRGYKVRVRYGETSSQDADQKRQAIARLIVGVMGRGK